MTREHSGTRRLASLVGLACLLATATVGATTVVSAAPASASCTNTSHINVEGYDSYSTHHGNRDMSTSTQATQLTVPKTISTGASSPSTISQTQMTWK